VYFLAEHCKNSNRPEKERYYRRLLEGDI
jgi:hypothetical protein